jgi:hypothetical protein
LQKLHTFQGASRKFCSALAFGWLLEEAPMVQANIAEAVELTPHTSSLIVQAVA